MIGMDVKRESRKSMLSLRPDDDDDDGDDEKLSLKKNGAKECVEIL